MENKESQQKQGRKIIFQIDLKRLKGAVNKDEGDVDALKIIFHGGKFLSDSNTNSACSSFFPVTNYSALSVSCKFEKIVNPQFYNEIVHNDKLVEVQYFRVPKEQQDKILTPQLAEQTTLTPEQQQCLFGKFYFDLFQVLQTAKRNQGSLDQTLNTTLNGTLNNTTTTKENGYKEWIFFEENPKHASKQQAGDGGGEQDSDATINKIKLLMTIHSSEPVLQENDKQNGNFMTFGVKKISNLPKSWILPAPEKPITENLFDYSLVIPIPEDDRGTVTEYEIEGGKLFLEKNAQTQQNSYIIGWEKGTKTFFLTEEGFNSLEMKASKKQKLNFFVRRKFKKEIMEKYPAESENWVDENDSFYKGYFQFDLEQFLKPGLKSIEIEEGSLSHSNSKNGIFTEKEKEKEKERLEKEKLEGGDGAGKGKKAPEKKAPPADPKKGKDKKGEYWPTELKLEPEVANIDKPDFIHPFEKEKTQISYLIEFQKPLIPSGKDIFAANQLCVADLIPKRQFLPQKIDPIEKFGKEIESVMKMLAYEFSKYKKTVANSKNGANVDTLNDNGDTPKEKEQPDNNTLPFSKEDFMFYLNHSGKFFALKDKIKKTVFEIVEEKFSNPNVTSEQQKGDEEVVNGGVTIPSPELNPKSNENSTESLEKQNTNNSSSTSIPKSKMNLLNPTSNNKLTLSNLMQKNLPSISTTNLSNKTIERNERNAQLFQKIGMSGTGVFQKEKFLNDLYVFLTQQMHKKLNEVFEVMMDEKNAIYDSFSHDKSANDNLEKLKNHAQEAEISQDFEKATIYYSKIVQSSSDNFQKNPSNQSINNLLQKAWFDYGVFCVKTTQFSKAENAFKELLSLNVSDISGLHGFGVLNLLKAKYAEGEVCLSSALNADLNNFMSWSLLAFFYKCQSKNSTANQHFIMADKLFDKYLRENAKEEKDYQLLDDLEKREKLKMILVNYFISLNAVSFAESVLNEIETEIESMQENPNEKKSRLTPQTILDQPKSKKEKLKTKALLERLIFHARIEIIKQDFNKAEEYLKKALSINHKSIIGWTLLADTYFNQKSAKLFDAIETYETCISLSIKKSNGKEVNNNTNNNGVDPVVYLRLGQLYLKTKQYPEAENAFLQCAKTSLGAKLCVVWLGIGVAEFYLQKYTEAEQALNEANIQNSTNPLVWGWLALVCTANPPQTEGQGPTNSVSGLQFGRNSEMEKCINQAIRFGLKNAPNNETLLELLKEKGFRI